MSKVICTVDAYKSSSEDDSLMGDESQDENDQVKLPFYQQEQIEQLLDEMAYEILDYKQIQKLKEIVEFINGFKDVK
jgi:hypothetical protein